MKSNKQSKETMNRITNEKPVSLFPLDFKEAVAALLRVKTKPRKPKTKKSEKQTRKPGS